MVDWMFELQYRYVGDPGAIPDTVLQFIFLKESLKEVPVRTSASELSITYLPIAKLKPNPHNSRTHSKHQIRQIGDSIEEFGFTNPALIDQNNMVIAGHGRLAAAKLLGMSRVPTIRLEALTPHQIRAYVVADNRLAEKAGWDEEILAIELQYLLTIEAAVDFDVTITGFEIAEVDAFLSAPQSTQNPDKDDAFDLSDAKEVVSRLGSLWQLGRHRVLCGNSTEKSSYSKLLGAKRAGVVFIDPPYNVAIEGNVSGKGSIRHRDFRMASGEMNEFQFISFLTTVLQMLVRYSVSGSVHFICMDWRHLGELIAAGKQVYESLLNMCVWVKSNGGMGSFYRSRHELVFVFRNGKGKHRNNVQLGRYGRNRTNVWEYSGITGLSKAGDEGNLLALHPTVKPVALVADALLDCSARGNLVLDAFLGSGSTLIAAERTGRCCFGIELDPLYVDTAIRRWQRHTGDHAIDIATGKRFDDLAKLSLGAQHE
jgi:DNA modification methylase